MTIPMVIGFAGSSCTANGTTGYRPKTMADLLAELPLYKFSFLNIADSGWATFPNLVNLADLSTANLIIFDQVNDESVDTAEVEALIRKAWTTGQRVISAVLPAWTVVENAQVNTPANQTALEQHLALCTAYGVPVVDFWQYCKDHVPGDYNLSDLYADTAHPSAIGYTIIETLLDDYLPNGGSVGTLPTRIYAASGDFEQPPVIKVGVQHDSHTGVWTENGTSISSAEVGATITFSGTFRKFGCYRASGAYPIVTVTIDGGIPIDNFAFYQNGYDIGARAAHTIVITVVTTCQIDEFWAI